MKRLGYLTAAVAVLAMVIAGVISVRRQQAAAARLARWEAEREEDAVPPVLSREMAWSRAEVTLADFAKLIESQSGLAVELDEEGAGTHGTQKRKLRDVVVQIPQGNFTLDAVLRMALAPQSLCADVRGQKVVITMPLISWERTRLRTAVYPLPRLKPIELEEEYWAQVVAANINGNHVEAVPGAILVVASAAGQRRARLVIDTISSLKAPTPDAVSIPPAPLGAAEKNILAALDLPVSLDVVEMPLKDVVLHLVERCGAPLILMADKLEEASVSLDTPITKSLKNLSLRSVLRLMLKDLELTYSVRDEAIVITTPEDAEEHLRTVAYPVQDLTQVGEGFFDVDSLAELVEACIAPDRWGTRSGPPTIRSMSEGWIIFEQTGDTHEQVLGLLTSMRRILQSDEQADAQSIDLQTEAERQIRAALDRPIDLDVRDMPLKDVVLKLQTFVKIPIILNLRRMEEASISADTPITYKSAMGRAGDELRQLLNEQLLDFVVRDEVLQITTPEDVESQLVTRVYDIRRLVGKLGSADELRKLIQATGQPGLWANVGGPGALEVYRGLLVVSHTERMHEEIEKLLAKLSEAVKNSTEVPPPVEKR